MFVSGGARTFGHQFYVYSLAEKQWTTLPGVEPRVQHSTVLVDDKLYIIGGRRSWQAGVSSYRSVSTFLAYDFVMCQSEHGMTRVENYQQVAVYLESRREILILEGFIIKLTALNVDTHNVTSLKVKGPPARWGAGGAVVEHCDKIFVFGPPMGGKRRPSNFNTLWVFHRGNWDVAVCSKLQTKNQVPARRTYMSLNVVNGYLMCFGGKVDINRLTNHVAIMNLRNSVWTEGSPDAEHTWWDYQGTWPQVDMNMAGVEFDGKLLLFGGRTSPGIIELKFSPY